MAVRATTVLKVGSPGHKHGTTWEPVRKAHSRAPPSPPESDTVPSICAFTNFRVTGKHTDG